MNELSLGLAALLGPGLAGWLALRSRGMDRCIVDYCRDAHRRFAPDPAAPVHVLLCIADHFEPAGMGVGPTVAARRLATWADRYPVLFNSFRDADGRPPQHTFFSPAEDYAASDLDALANLCRGGFGEVEVHLHHHDDTSTQLRRTLDGFKEALVDRHGLLSRRRDGGEVAYGFIHGNWALDNSHPNGRFCGVNDELDVLRESGCYADFTMPSAPDRCQTRTSNRIYRAVDDPSRPRSHDRGIEVGVRPAPDNALMMIQGPLVLNWTARKWGLIPRLENGCIQANQPPTAARMDDWIRARVQVRTRPDWFFVKLHTHGAIEANQAVLLGEPMVRFHRDLAARAAADPRFQFHYVTARELYNLARAAEDGFTGSVAAARDYEIVSNLRPTGLCRTSRGLNSAGVAESSATAEG